MSKNISIKEGGVAKQMTVDKLKTNLVGGGTCLWVPEDGVVLGQKVISENGTYKASDDGLYGYSQVTVSNAGIASGTIPSGATVPTGDGNEYAVTTDGSGNLEFLKIPSSIRVTSPATKTEYFDGEAIDTTGMVVTAYNADGTKWTSTSYPNGEIPISQLIIEPTVVDASQVSMRSAHTSDLDIGNLTYPVYSFSSANVTLESTYANLRQIRGYYSIDPNNEDVQFVVQSDIGGGIVRVIAASKSQGSFIYRDLLVDLTTGEAVSDTIETKGITGRFAHNGKIAYHGYVQGSTYFDVTEGDISYSASLDSIVDRADNLAWSILYGEETEKEGTLKTTIKWPRTGDGKILETSFEVTVVGREFGGGQTSGGGAGRND